MNDRISNVDGTDGWEILVGSGHLLYRKLAGEIVSVHATTVPYSRKKSGIRKVLISTLIAIGR